MSIWWESNRCRSGRGSSRIAGMTTRKTKSRISKISWDVGHRWPRPVVVVIAEEAMIQSAASFCKWPLDCYCCSRSVWPALMSAWDCRQCCQNHEDGVNRKFRDLKPEVGRRYIRWRCRWKRKHQALIQISTILRAITFTETGEKTMPQKNN
jgi:hypothetical protein